MPDSQDREPIPSGEAACPLPRPPDLSRVELLRLRPRPSPAGYREAMRLASREAARRLADPMLLSWYDHDRGYESPQHAGECHRDSATPGYVDYGLHHGASLMIDIEAGRFVFFFADCAQR